MKSTRKLFAFALLACACLGARADVMANWTSIAVDAARDARVSTATAERGLALVNEAMRAAAGVRDGNGNGNGNGSPAGHERSDAAAAVAAFVVLESLYPDQRDDLEARLAVTFSRIPETDAKAEGAAAGRRIASELLRAR
jgi:hypothetical protein